MNGDSDVVIIKPLTDVSKVPEVSVFFFLPDTTHIEARLVKKDAYLIFGCVDNTCQPSFLGTSCRLVLIVGWI